MITRRWLTGLGAGSLLILGGIAAGPVASLAREQGQTQYTRAAAHATTQQTFQWDAAFNHQRTLAAATVRVVNASSDTAAESRQSDPAAQGQAAIIPDQAQQIALAANPGTTATSVELGDENGTLVYDVQLSNGSDVKVDANTGQILGTDQADPNESNGSATSDGPDANDGAQSSDQTQVDQGGADQSDQQN